MLLLQVRRGPGSRRAPRRVLFLALPLLTACGGGEPSGATGLDALPTFTVAAEPEVTVGVVKGEAPYLLGGVADALRLDDGTLVVADCAAGELRSYDARGRFLRSVGRLGEGPGEFTFLRRVFRGGGDTLVAWDGLRLRATVFTPEGRVARTFELPLASGLSVPDVLGRLEDGSFVARRPDLRTTAAPGTPYRAAVTLLLLDAGGRPSDSVADLPAGDLMAPATPRGPYLGLRFARTAVFAVTPHGVYYGGQDGTGVIRFDAALGRVGATRTLTRPDPVAADVEAAYRAVLDEGADRPPDGVVPATVAAFPDSLPAYGDLVAGTDGRLWVQDPSRPGRYPLAWTAYRDGAAVARLEMPPRFFPFELGPDWVLGVAYDELSVERVELWRTERGPLPGRILPPRDAAPPMISRCGAWASR